MYTLKHEVIRPTLVKQPTQEVLLRLFPVRVKKEDYQRFLSQQRKR